MPLIILLYFIQYFTLGRVRTFFFDEKQHTKIRGMLVCCASMDILSAWHTYAILSDGMCCAKPELGQHLILLRERVHVGIIKNTVLSTLQGEYAKRHGCVSLDEGARICRCVSCRPRALSLAFVWTPRTDSGFWNLMQRGCTDHILVHSAQIFIHRRV
jgi:hypothetical protein